MKQKPVVFAGSFDPVTNGHLDLIRRARDVFGAVVVVVAENARKQYCFTAQERADLLREALKKEKNVRVDSCKGLLADYLKKHKLHVLVRGLRGADDMQGELAGAFYNKLFYPLAETVFLPAAQGQEFISSPAVKEAALFGADVSACVPPCVARELRRKIKGK